MELIHSIIDFILHIDKHLVQITSQYQSWTYLILFIIIFAETGFVVTPFLPGDSLLFAAGALIAGGKSGLDIYLLTVILIIAAVSGNTVNYLLGKFLGAKVFKEENKILKLSYYLQTKAFFDKHGGKAVIFSRFVPIIRTVAPFVAGVGHMPFTRYTLYNVVGGVSWILIFLFCGFWFGKVPFIEKNFSLVAIIIILVSIIPPIIAILKSKFSKKEAA
ncbi:MULTISPECIES: DedA family protein [unclassified Mucilaginibacter]|uniref:DedA family protein n=1 Tax=unclassified Mucilaginibacter TaxID=2617802 RepID=UPI002AC9276C|nr:MULTISPECIES: DedA family protein [unclassified Mucilaginibacter]MEB0262405.1 DedA family protein [Mucilaginibacter sp. 10I4]MEB0277938.1 DedA family protein [Mucilaginibacter sp. 10B2]MEB0299709.1 DedA family protein [Mucilaginibacter sp. 5C4]WPX22829.1 DedA family protein [Mucilaginibacter sp. 5C4]